MATRHFLVTFTFRDTSVQHTVEAHDEADALRIAQSLEKLAIHVIDVKDTADAKRRAR